MSLVPEAHIIAISRPIDGEVDAPLSNTAALAALTHLTGTVYG